MLVLSRKTNERILIDGNIKITVLGIRGNQVRIGIEAPGSVKVIRAELAPEATPLNAVTTPGAPLRSEAPLGHLVRADRSELENPSLTGSMAH